MKTAVATLALAALAQASPVGQKTNKIARRSYDGHMDKANLPFYFTSTFSIHATPDQVVDANNTFTGGLEGASGIFNFGINSHDNVICYNITLNDFRGEYQSPAETATHIHEAPRGEAGPPRLAFANPTGEGATRNSVGCLKGPFTTGVKADDGSDTGDGFHVKQIEDRPAHFFADTHSSLAVPGAVRGQLGPDDC